MTPLYRKRYLAPSVDSIKVDREITLVMATNPPPDPPGAPQFYEEDTKKHESKSPFGGDKPDYSKM